MIDLRARLAVGGAADPSGRDLLGPAVLVLTGGAWLLVVAGQLTGSVSLVHQHGVVAATLPAWLALASFLVSWQIMVAATMLPASLPSIRLAATIAGGRVRSGRSTVTFLAGFAAVWTGVGLLAAAGQAVGDALGADSWLATRPWLLQASVIALAGAYQLTSLKRRSLAACRHPDRLPAHAQAVGTAFFEAGLRHGLACVGSAWALMAVMVVAGLGDLWWMAALAGVMVYEATGRYGQRLATIVGPLLLWLAALILLPGWLPA